MATKSILKAIHIKNPKTAGKLADILENSSKVPVRETVIARSVSNATREDIEKMFGTDK